MELWAERALLIRDLGAPSLTPPLHKLPQWGPSSPHAGQAYRDILSTLFPGCPHAVAVHVPEPGLSPLPLPLGTLK